jgi:hypothetical protein
MKILTMFCDYICGIRFLMESDANASVHQLNLPTNYLPGAQITGWMAWIELFNLSVKYFPGRLNGCHDGLSSQERVPGEPQPEEEDD